MVRKSVVEVIESARGTRGLGGKIADAVAAQPALFPELMFGLWHVEAEIRSIAADAVEKVTQQHADWLAPFKTELLGLMVEARPAQVRWHLAQMVPRLKLNAAERKWAERILGEYLEDRSAIVRVFAMDSLVEMAGDNRNALGQAADLIRGQMKGGTAAVKARGRILLKKIQSK